MGELIKAGGSAFPSHFKRLGDIDFISPGMALRDYFAAKAMAAIIHLDVKGSLSINDVAKCSYAQADAMLAAREVK